MGIALVTLADLFIPLRSLANRWIPARGAHRSRSAALRYVVVQPDCTARTTAAPGKAETAAAWRPLRVVRKVDADQPGMGSRIVISGRMADVCAELDRLAALETAGARHPSPSGMH